MKKFILLLITICFIVVPFCNKKDDLENTKRSNSNNQVNKIALINDTDTLSWKEAYDNKVNLGGYTIVFKISFVGMVTISSSYCSLFFDTNGANDFVIDIEASGYPTYTFTNRNEMDTFATKASYSGGTVEYIIPENVTTINSFSFTKTHMASGYTSDDDILNDFIYFVAPVEHESISFSYQVLPVEANDKSVNIELIWSDSSINDDISEFLTYKHDSLNSKITVSCLQKSNNQAKLIIISNDNKNITASVLIDFEQEFLGFNSTTITLNKTLSLESNEVLVNEDDIKKEILNQSKGFLGTVSINDKEISNFSMSFSRATIELNNPDVQSFISYNTTFNNVYKEARNLAINSLDFIDNISNNFISTLTNTQKQTIRDSESITLIGTYIVSFKYYGKSYAMICNLCDNVSNTAFANSTYVNVDSITIKDTIIFK